MSSFTNITGADLVVTDEIGLPVKFTAGETKSGLSNYFKNYTAAIMGTSNALLSLSLDDGLATPPPGNDGQNVAVLPGHPTIVAATNMGTHDFPGSSEHDKKVLFDASEESQSAPSNPGGYLRTIDTTHLGFKTTEDNPPDPVSVDDGIYVDSGHDRIFLVLGSNVWQFTVTDVTP